MFRLSVIFFIIAIIAGIFGFSGVAASSASFAKILFYISLVLFIASLIVAQFRKV